MGIIAQFIVVGALIGFGPVIPVLLIAHAVKRARSDRSRRPRIVALATGSLVLWIVCSWLMLAVTYGVLLSGASNLFQFTMSVLVAGFYGALGWAFLWSMRDKAAA
jgi:hypothetical protein